MKKFLIPAVLATVVGLAYLPAQAQASWFSEAFHNTRVNVYAPPVYASPVYAPPVYAPPVYAPPVYTQSPAYVQPAYVQPAYVQPPVCATPAPVIVPTVSYRPAYPSYYVAPRHYSHYQHHHR